MCCWGEATERAALRSQSSCDAPQVSRLDWITASPASRPPPTLPPSLPCCFSLDNCPRFLSYSFIRSLLSLTLHFILSFYFNIYASPLSLLQAFTLYSSFVLVFLSFLHSQLPIHHSFANLIPPSFCHSLISSQPYLPHGFIPSQNQFLVH